MNDQVRKYLNHQKFLRFLESINAEKWVIPTPERGYIYYEMAKGTDVKHMVDEDDLSFVQAVRQKWGADSMLPEPPKILQTKYVLLHPEPLHNYSTHREGDQQVIIENGGTNQKVTVNDRMRDLYKQAMNKKWSDSQPPSEKKKPKPPAVDVSPTPENDKKVAEWWIEDNRNVIHAGSGRKKDEDEGDLPKQLAKIVRRGSNSVDLAFRSSKKYWGWKVVKEIPIDMEKFRAKVSAEGFNQDRHAVEFLKISPSTWENAIRVAEGGDKKDPSAALKAGKQFSAGYFSTDNDPDPVFINRYNKETNFRKAVEKVVIIAVQVAYRRMLNGSFVRIQEDRPSEYGDGETGEWHSGGIDYYISVPPGSVSVEHVKDALTEARVRVTTHSGKSVSGIDWNTVKPEDIYDINKSDEEDGELEAGVATRHAASSWIMRQANTGATNAISKQGKLVNKERTATGMGVGAGEEGGSMDDLQKSPAKGDFTQFRAGDDEDSESEDLQPHELLQHIKDNGMNDEWTRDQIAKVAASGNAQFQKLADMLGIEYGSEPEEPDFEEEPEEDDASEEEVRARIIRDPGSIHSDPWVRKHILRFAQQGHAAFKAVADRNNITPATVNPTGTPEKYGSRMPVNAESFSQYLVRRMNLRENIVKKK